MRANRLIDIVLVLQQRGRVTAPELANELEVSVRTVYRDLEALGSAGLPIYAVRGAAGGFELLPGFRLDLAGLSEPEQRVVPLVGQPEVARALGLSTVTRQARHKLDAGRVRQGRVEEWFRHDPTLLDGRLDHPYVPRLRRAIERGRVVAAELGGAEVELIPRRLVLRAGEWLVEADDADGSLCLVAVAELTGLRVTRRARMDL